MVINLRHFFILIIIVNLLTLIFFFAYRSDTTKKKTSEKTKDAFLQKFDTKTIFGRRNATSPANKAYRNTTINPKLIKPKKSKKKEKIDFFMNYNIFQNLSLYTHLNKHYFNDDPNIMMSYSIPNMGLINEDDYCKEVDRQNLNSPNMVLNQMTFLTDYNADGLARQLVMRNMGTDVFPDEVSKDMNKTMWNSVIIILSVFSKIIKANL